MKNEQDYIQDIADIRSMMERSSKFMSLSGLAGIMAGLYALAGAWIAYRVYQFEPDSIRYADANGHLTEIILLAVVILILAVGTAIILSRKKAQKRGEAAWNATSRRMLAHMAVPLLAGGILILLLLSRGGIGLMAPLTLLFYGLGLYNASKFTYDDLKLLGLIQTGLGLLSVWLITYSLLIWALGFGVIHIVYGIYMHFRYER